MSAALSVTCATNKFAVGGTVAGFTGTGLVLRDNGGDDLPVPDGATSFVFPTKVASGAAFAVTVHTQPSVRSRPVRWQAAAARSAPATSRA